MSSIDGLLLEVCDTTPHTQLPSIISRTYSISLSFDSSFAHNILEACLGMRIVPVVSVFPSSDLPRVFRWQGMWYQSIIKRWRVHNLAQIRVWLVGCSIIRIISCKSVSSISLKPQRRATIHIDMTRTRFRQFHNKGCRIILSDSSLDCMAWISTSPHHARRPCFLLLSTSIRRRKDRSALA